MTIIVIAAAAIGAVTAYRSRQQSDASGLTTSMTNIRQSTSVVLALGEAVWAILDALQLLFRRSASVGRPISVSAGSARFGQPAAEVSGD